LPPQITFPCFERHPPYGPADPARGFASRQVVEILIGEGIEEGNRNLNSLKLLSTPAFALQAA